MPLSVSLHRVLRRWRRKWRSAQASGAAPPKVSCVAALMMAILVATLVVAVTLTVGLAIFSLVEDSSGLQAELLNFEVFSSETDDISGNSGSDIAEIGQKLMKQQATLIIGYCPGDNLARFARDVGAALAKRRQMRFKMMPVQSPEHEAFVDIIMCERGTTGMVQRKRDRMRAKAPSSSLSLQSLIPPPHGPGWRGNIMWPARVHVLNVEREPVKPFIIRYHMEPWYTAPAEGVDLSIDCKHDSKKLSNQHVHMYAPYLYMSFTHRGSDVKPEVLASRQVNQLDSPLPLHHLSKGEDLNHEERKFMGFLASYCSSRVPSAVFRVMFFNAVHDRFAPLGKEVAAVGNCRPRTVSQKEPIFRLRASANLVEPDMFSDAVAAFSRFRFGIAFENSQVEGYITEKIVNVKLAGAIPVVWGAPDIDKYLNTRAFVWCKIDTGVVNWNDLAARASKLSEVTSQPKIDIIEKEALMLLGGSDKVFRSCLDEIAYLESNPAAYDSMRNEPLILEFEGSVIDPDMYAASIEEVMRGQQSGLTMISSHEGP